MTTYTRLIKEHQEFERLDEAVGQQDKLKEKEMQFKRLGIEDKLKNVRLLEGEENVKARIVEQFNLVQQWLDAYKDVFDLGFLQDFNIEKLPNKGSVVKGRQIFERLQAILDGLIDQANKGFQKAKSNHETIQSIWQEASDKIRDELNQVIAKLPEQAGKTGKALGVEYTDIIRKLTLIDSQKKPHKNQKGLISLIVSERKSLLEEYRDTAFQRFDSTHKAIEELNHNRLKGKVKINVIRCGNVEPLKDFLLGIENIGQSKTQWLDEAGIELDLVKWVEWIKERNAKAFMDKYKSFGLTQGVVDKLLSLNLEKRLELQEIELKDKVNIDLNTAHADTDVHYVPLDELSTGQKCTAILNLLFLSCDDPLIIDQPEDNLDNAFIAERIVQDLRQFKTNRQFLFATHNANIPVFGDAELIAVLDSSHDKGRVKNIGSIDKPEVGSQAAEILEGGEAAFNIRKEKYGF